MNEYRDMKWRIIAYFRLRQSGWLAELSDKWIKGVCGDGSDGMYYADQLANSYSTISHLETHNYIILGTVRSYGLGGGGRI